MPVDFSFVSVEDSDARIIEQPTGPRIGIPDVLPPKVEFDAFPESSFTSRLPADIAVSPGSDAYSALLRKVISEDGSALSLRTFTVPIYLVDESTPLHDVSLTAEWSPASVIYDVPIPDGALADPEDDGNIAIIDRTRRCEWDIWQAKSSDTGWRASWANAISLDGNGVFPHGMSSRGSGFALTQGLIWPEEIQRGRIDHALIFSYPFTSSAGSVGEASETDGWSDRPDALPEGARLRLDPSLDVTSLGLPDWLATIAVAMQEYGLVLVDDGGGVQLYGVHSWSSVEDPWSEVLETGAEYVLLDDLPWDRVEVLDFGEPVDLEVLFRPDACASFDVASE